MTLNKTLRAYFPGIILFLIALLIGILTYQDYGMSWDEQAQRGLGELCYNYLFNNSPDLLTYPDRQYGTGFELPLMMLEKLLKITDSRDIYLMRHWVNHFLFLVSGLSAYVLFFRLYKNKFIACIGFIMLVFCPRIYAHSFYNTKDIPFLSMFIITLTFCHMAFSKNRPIPFLILGLLCGYTTSIRIMGVLLLLVILLFLLIDLATNLIMKKEKRKPITNLFVFVFGFCFAVYVSWPYLWHAPLHNFLESYSRMAHFDWGGDVLINGRMIMANNLPWTYFPTWFLISIPILWVLSGIIGTILIIINFIKRPLGYFKNIEDRNFILYLFCFLAPILAVIFLHSEIYDDWRQLYFVYPSFVLLALYFINKIFNTRYKFTMQLLCIAQVSYASCFMIESHPFQQVYFNELVSHKNEFLRTHYEMDYWGSSMKQGLEYLIEKYKDGPIKITSDVDRDRTPLNNNILMLKKEDRNRIVRTPANDADFFITNFRSNPSGYSYKKVEYSATALNSTILCVYQMH